MVSPVGIEPTTAALKGGFSSPPWYTISISDNALYQSIEKCEIMTDDTAAVAPASPNPESEIQELKARIEDLEARLKRHNNDWLAYQADLIDKACPNWANHTPQPNEARQWKAWAAEMQKTHRQARCPACNLYQLWIPGEDLN